MKNRILPLLAFSAVALVVGLGASARFPVAKAAAAKSTTPGTIAVGGNSQVLVVPDQIELRVGITSHDAVLAKSKADNDTRSAAVLARLRELGLPARDVQTDAINVQPEYRTDNGNPPVLVRYMVQRHVVVTLRDVSRFEAVLQGALDAGANEVMNIQFCTTELRKYRDQARQMAIKAAREKAELLAAGLGAKVGRPVTVNDQSQDYGWSSYSYYSSYGGGYYSQYRGGGGYMSQNSIAVAPGGNEPGPEASSTAFAPGQIRVNAMVAVTFELE